MRSIRIAVLSIGLCLLIWSSAPRAATFRAGGGLDLSTGTLGQRTKPGWHISGGYGPTIFSSQHQRFDAILNGSYSSFETDIPYDGDYAIIRGGLDLRLMYDHSSNSQYYLIAGGGIASVKVQGFQIGSVMVAETKETNPYISIGFGAVIGKTSGLRPFVEFRFTDISGKHLSEYKMFELTLGLMR